MGNFLRRTREKRSQRLDANPGMYSCAVRFSPLGDSNSRWAQYADISETGMKLISTKPHQTEVGTILDLNFSLVGGSHEISKKARVVRQANEFVLGVQFLNPTEDFKFIFFQHARFVKRLPWAAPFKRAHRWFSEHRIGLRIAIAAATFFVFTASVIYLFSDDFAGRNRGWGEVYSDDVDLSYVHGYSNEIQNSRQEE